MYRRTILSALLATVAALVFNVVNAFSQDIPNRPTGRELFYADSLNARFLYRTYPVPDVEYTPAPEGYEPVYISSYARHGSRKLIGQSKNRRTREILAEADSLGLLTDLGREVYAKIVRIDDSQRVSDSDLTSAGFAQHRGIADRMYANYPNVFCHEGTPVRFYSTAIQRTMMSMFACNQRLLELNPTIKSTNQASRGLSYMVRHPEFPAGMGRDNFLGDFLHAYLDCGPILDRLFTGPVPSMGDPAVFVSYLYHCASISLGLDLQDVDFLWDLFTYDELYILCQATNYHNYMGDSNSPVLGFFSPNAMCPLLKDFIDKADAALGQEVPGADLRFGHDTYLISFSTLIGLNGVVRQVEDPLEVIDTFQNFKVAPMAGNVQMVFFRNGGGDVIVKVLQQEVEAWLPVQTDIYPYYHWSDLRAYFVSLLKPEFLDPPLEPSIW